LKISRTLSFIVAICIAFWLYGCTNLPYYAQAVDGQMEILRKVQPISTIVADPNTDKALKNTLSKVILLRKFASRTLKLPDNESYMSYADLKRPYVVWNVYATPEFSVKLKEWCFVGAGCVEYRGFFSKEKADHFAEELRNKGYDVHVGGIRAYSTLGWLDDPVLNTFIGFSEIQLARLIFHELAHQIVYVRDDTEFNESFATMVELEGTRRWLASNGTSEQQDTFDAGQKREIIFTELVLKYRERLKKLFSSGANDSDKRISKSYIFSELRDEFSQLKDADKELSSYDQWFELQMNNALLSTISTYTKHVPEFRSLLTRQGGDMELFYSAVRDIGKLTKSDRYSALQVRRKDLPGDVLGKKIWSVQYNGELLEKK
jgi:predicted aminopeptidase